MTQHSREGTETRALVEVALADRIETPKPSKPRSHVMAAYQRSHESYAQLYDKLAK